MGEGIARTTFHINNAQDLNPFTDGNTHFRTCLPAFDGVITLILKHIVNDNAFTGFKYKAYHPANDWILDRFDGASDHVLTRTAKAANGEVPIFISYENCGKFISKIT